MSKEQMGSEAGPIMSQISEDSENSAIYFYKEFKPEQTCILDTNNLNKNILPFHSHREFSILCSLPNNKILCIWQQIRMSSEILFSLDSQGNIVNYRVPSHKAILKSKMAIYYNYNMVFIFGSQKWYKIDINRNIFFTIGGGDGSVYYSCALLNDYVIFSKQHPVHEFDVYDILTNSKSSMSSVYIGTMKHLFSLNENIYAVDANGYLFLLELWSPEWKFIGLIKTWRVEELSYWLYWKSEVYARTNSTDIVKFDMKHINLNIEIIKLTPFPNREINELDSSRVYEKLNFNIHPLWKKRITPVIAKALKTFWYLVALEEEHIGLFPLILEKLPGRDGRYFSLDLNERVNYFFELFNQKDPKTIKIVILISKPKKNLIDIDSLFIKINAIRLYLETRKNISRLKNNIIVLSPYVFIERMGKETLNTFNEFMIEMAKVLNSMLDKAVFMLWGKEARKCSEFLDQSKHLLMRNSNMLTLDSDCEKYKKFKDSINFELAYSYLYQ